MNDPKKNVASREGNGGEDFDEKSLSRWETDGGMCHAEEENNLNTEPAQTP